MAIDPVGDLIQASEIFSQVATRDPFAGVLLAAGALLTGVSILVFGGLSLGGMLSAIARFGEVPGPRE